jgi:hypothetical protein
MARINTPFPGSPASYGAPSGISTATTQANQVTMVSPVQDLVARDLYAEVSTAPGAGAQWTIALKVGAAATLTCTISGATSKICENISTTESIPARSTLSIQITPSGPPSAPSPTPEILVGWRTVLP